MNLGHFKSVTARFRPRWAGTVLAVAFVIGLPVAARADGTIRLRVGQSKSIGFKSQVIGVRLANRGPGIATDRYRRGRIYFSGVKPGKTTVIVTGKKVRYIVGIPPVRRGRRVNRLPLRQNIRFTERVKVIVTAAPEKKKKPRPQTGGGKKAAAHRQPVIMRVGQVKGLKFEKPVRRYRFAKSGVAQARRTKSGVDLRGAKPGSTTLVVEGDGFRETVKVYVFPAREIPREKRASADRD